MLDFFAKQKGKQGLVGISASADKLCLAHVVSARGMPTLASCDELPTSSEKGFGDLLAKQVRSRGLDNTPTNFVLPTADYKIFLVEAPRVEPQELESAIKWKIKDLVDTPVTELAVTLFPVPEDAYRSQGDMVYVVAAKKSVIRNVVSLVIDAGLSLQYIDIPELVLMNISRNFNDDSHGLAFIDLRNDGSTLNFCKDGMIYLTRHLSTRVQQGLITSKEWESVRDRLVLEIQRSLDYYESQMGQSPITEIVIAPRGEDTQDLAEQLNQSLAARVSALNMAGSLGHKTDDDEDQEFGADKQRHCVLAIGGALRNRQAAA